MNWTHRIETCERDILELVNLYKSLCEQSDILRQNVDAIELLLDIGGIRLRHSPLGIRYVYCAPELFCVDDIQDAYDQVSSAVRKMESWQTLVNPKLTDDYTPLVSLGALATRYYPNFPNDCAPLCGE